jgi:hypothetical protein
VFALLYCHHLIWADTLVCPYNGKIFHHNKE